MAIQIFTVAFGFMGLPAMPAFYRHLPIFKRFTYASFMYALSRAVIYSYYFWTCIYYKLFRTLGDFSYCSIANPIELLG